MYGSYKTVLVFLRSYILLFLNAAVDTVYETGMKLEWALKGLEPACNWLLDAISGLSESLLSERRYDFIPSNQFR